jgi:sortase A
MHKRFNQILFGIIILFCAGILLTPYAPEVEFALNPPVFTDNSSLTLGESDEVPYTPDENRLIIPQIKVDTEVFEGTEAVLNYGAWRRPNTSTPDRGGNTVITAHRFLYTSGGNTFYHLDKLQIGQEFSVYWKQVEYKYRVYEKFEVYPNQVEIEDNTKNDILTLYTCTPLWTSEKRLVVRAEKL